MEKQNVTVKMLKDSLKLNAIAWKAGTKGISYGQFVSNLSDQEKDLIYEEYEQMLEIRKEEENARLETARLVQSEKKKKRAREKKCY